MTPNALASFERAMMQPSLSDRTTTGVPRIAGRNTNQAVLFRFFDYLVTLWVPLGSPGARLGQVERRTGLCLPYWVMASCYCYSCYSCYSRRMCNLYTVRLSRDEVKHLLSHRELIGKNYRDVVNV